MKTTPEQRAAWKSLAETYPQAEFSTEVVCALIADLDAVRNDAAEAWGWVRDTNQLSIAESRLQHENVALRQQIVASDAALLESRVSDREAMRQLGELKRGYDELLSAYKHLSKKLTDAEALVKQAEAMFGYSVQGAWLRRKNAGAIALEATIAEAVATAVESYKRDADRYRWLCNVATESQWIEFGGYTVKKHVDAAIDSAMTTQGEPTMKTIWNTTEADCWCRDFEYEAYVSVCTHTGEQVLCEETYKLLCKAFQAQFDEDMSNITIPSEFDYDVSV